VQSGITLDGLRWAFTTKYTGLWNPLVWMSFMVDHEFFGLNAGGYHLTNLLLHILTTLLLFWLFHRMTGAVWRSAFVAALFALHPLHVESVAWISERKDVLSAFFWVLTLYLYVRYTEKPLLRRYLPVLFSFMLALMSKPMVVTLPVIMILLDYWPLKRFSRQTDKLDLLWGQFKEKAPFFVLSAVLLMMIFSPLFHFETLQVSSSVTDATKIPLFSRLANAPVAFVTYLAKTFWPGDLAVFYPFPAQIPLSEAIAASLFILLVSIAVMLAARRMPYLFVGWFWYAIAIAPVLGILQISYTAPYAMADRYHYLPSIGIAVMLAWGIPSMIRNPFMKKAVLLPASLLFLAALTFLTWQQCGYWRDSITLFNQALKATENNFMAHNNLGLAMMEDGKIEESINHFDKAIGLHQNYVIAYYNRGNAYAQMGQYQRAFEDYDKAISLRPDYARAYYNRGTLYTLSGRHHLALDDLNKSIKLNPHYAAAYNNRGGIYLNQGNINRGCEDARRACERGICKTLGWAKQQGYCF
jgi:tetratricopeptide (TPR) repeat protein